jgi:N-ethylmaleimide reductase
MPAFVGTIENIRGICMSNGAHATNATTVASTESLFSPYRFGKVELKNRVVMAPMTRSRCSGMVPIEDVAEYYKR